MAQGWPLPRQGADLFLKRQHNGGAKKSEHPEQAQGMQGRPPHFASPHVSRRHMVVWRLRGVQCELWSESQHPHAQDAMQANPHTGRHLFAQPHCQRTDSKAIHELDT